MVCTLERVIYEDRSAGFMIASFKTKDEAVPSDARSTFTRGDKMIRFTAVGYRLPTTGAIDVDLDGHWEKNKYGLQLAVDRCVEIIPKTKDGITAYLSSGLIKGIGTKTAKLIVDAFGVKTLEVIEKEPQKLLTVKGITEKKLKSITDSYTQSKSIRDIVSYLSPYGVTVKKCARIQEEFGAQTMDILKNRPFELCSISGFGFKTVDEIARKTSCTPNDPMRIRGALQFTLDDSMTAGHLYLGKETLRNKAHELLNAGYEREVVTLAEIHTVLCSMVKDNTFVHENGCIYTRRNHFNEKETADAIAAILQDKVQAVDVTKELAESQQALGIILSPKQTEAVKMCFSSNLSIITGGPGTGKTTVLRVILDVYRRICEKGEILLTAPTGRAARRMEESTGYEACTLHKALGLITDEDDTGALNETSDLTADFIITDEFSMVDMALAKELFTRISGGARILLVGDADQLPSVGAGNVFRELMQCGRIPVTRLDLVYRQSGTSRIAINAKLMQEDDTRLHFGEDFLFCPCESEEQAADRVCQLYMDEIAQHGIEKVQILSPFKSRGDTCVKNLNDHLREIINPPSPKTTEMKVGTRIYRTGDRVLQTRNIDEISNGDVGFIRQIIKEEDDTCSALIEFGDRSRTYSQDEMDMIELAYAMTIHKSQGSEYNTVIIPMMASHYIMLRRNLIYTAITRAKKKVILVGEKKAIYTAIHKNDIDGRNTRLAERIINQR